MRRAAAALPEGGLGLCRAAGGGVRAVAGCGLRRGGDERLAVVGGVSDGVSGGVSGGGLNAGFSRADSDGGILLTTV